jgi:hypothetical protein
MGVNGPAPIFPPPTTPARLNDGLRFEDGMGAVLTVVSEDVGAGWTWFEQAWGQKVRPSLSFKLKTMIPNQ